MSDPRQAFEVGARLAELVDMAGRAATLPPVDAIRTRARRRVRYRQGTAGALAALLVAGGATGVRYLVAASRPPGPPVVVETTTTGPAVPSSAPATGSPTSTSSQTPTGTQPAGQAGGSLCRKAGLTVSVGPVEGASGHRSVPVLFTNIGAQPCRLRGYPGVAAVDSNERQVAQAKRTLHGYMGGLATGTTLPTVTLLPGRSASALVEALAFNASDGSACTAYYGLLVTAPDDTESTRLPWGNDGCSDLQIHPVVPGTSGRTS
jgi:hypothetical protein